MNNKITTKYTDWRLLGTKTLQEDWTHPTTDKVYKAGSPIELVGSVNYDGFHTLDFPIPSMTSLFLSQAYEDWTASQHFLTEEEFLDKPDKTDVSTVIHPKEDYIFFSLLQQRMVAIVFAYTALESFANESIPETYIFKRLRDDKKCTEEFNKEQAEHLSLDTKLHEVLPLIFGIKSPKGTIVWQKYISLKKLRDRIIHMKSKDKEPSKPRDETIWSELLNKSYPNLALEAKAVIGYYLDSLPTKPRWFIEFWDK